MEAGGVNAVPTDEPTEGQEKRLENIIGWARTAKEILPTLGDGRVAADRIARMSGLLDRLYANAIRTRVRMAAEGRRRAA